MMTLMKRSTRFLVCCFGLLFLVAIAVALAGQSSQSQPEVLPTGMMITPTAARGSIFQPLNPGLPDLPQFTVDHPVTTAVSPDGDTLLILTSGFNQNHVTHGNAIPHQSHPYILSYP